MAERKPTHRTLDLAPPTTDLGAGSTAPLQGMSVNQRIRREKGKRSLTDAERAAKARTIRGHIGAQISEKQLRELDAYCERTGISRSAAIRDALIAAGCMTSDDD